LQVLTAWAFAGQPGEQVTAWERGIAALGIHPPAARVGPGAAQPSPDGPVDVHVAAGRAAVAPVQSGVVVPVGAVHLRQDGGRGEEAAEDLLAAHGRDPLAVRLALIRYPYHQPVGLTEGALDGADGTIGDWRRGVAGWAQSPSRPMPAPVAAKVRDAFAELDTVSVLAVLQDVASDDGVPGGAKFETFVYADRLLGLDLARDIGRS
jgi:hypothetical protein